MTRYLKAVTSAAPHLVRAFSIGKSKAGRPILVAEVTNRNLREGREKPGLWIDGGHQGWNLLGSTSCLELLRFLVSGHGRDEFLTDLVDHTVFYIAPRLAPDEMEQCLLTGALVPQSEGTPRLSLEGRQFRVETPLGSWKPFKRDNRVMVARNPEDRKGPFYDLYRQLDSDRLSRVGPSDFPQQNLLAEQSPLQLPSTRAVHEFMKTYTNVFGVISTSGPGDRISLVSERPKDGLLNMLGHRLGELSGLPYAGLREAQRSQGEFLSWVVDSLGVLAVDCQLWSLRTAAGLKEAEFEDPFQAGETETLQLLRFCEKEFPENSYSEWVPKQDSVLGQGDQGGWDWSRTWLNPPSGPYLERELKKLSRLALGLASASPRVRLARTEEKVVGWSDDRMPLRCLSVEVHNSGYLPTCAHSGGRRASGRVELNLGQNELLLGHTSTPLEELRGVGVPPSQDGFPSAGDTGTLPPIRSLELKYLVRGAGPVEILAHHPLGGTDTTVSRPPQNLRPPSFDSGSVPEVVMVEPESQEDPFEEAFPSFEDLYVEPVVATTPPSIPSPPAPPIERVVAAAEPPPPYRAPEPEFAGGFNIPDPTPSVPPPPRTIQFGELDSTPAPSSSGPFPASKPNKGRVFGSPPQKPTGGLPAALKGPAGSPEKPQPAVEGDFSPLPLVKPQNDPGGAFEPMLPTQEPAAQIDRPGKVLGETIPGDVPAPGRPKQPEEQPAAPPARLSRMSAPQLLRRQRGAQGPPNEPFKRS